MKAIPIKTCWQCPHFTLKCSKKNSLLCQCKKSNRRDIANYTPRSDKTPTLAPPDWCPLDDYDLIHLPAIISGEIV